VRYWDRATWHTPAPKRPPPERGIKMTKAGSTWWGQRWIESLENVLSGDSARLARGRSYARAGRTHDLVIQGGKVSAKVTGSRATPYKITIELGQLPAAAWKKAILNLAQKAQFSAELLAGQMPKEIDEAFRSAKLSLFPKRREDLVTSCSCPDWGDPCKHVAATHYVLGEALDRDPFLLFELRGRTKAQVLDALRSARGGEPAALPKQGRSTEFKVPVANVEPAVPRVQLGKVAPADYDRAREALPALHFSFDAPLTHGAVLRQLGVPAGWGESGSPAAALSSTVQRAAEAARRIAMAEPRPPATPDDRAAASSPAERRRTKAKTAKTAKTARRSARNVGARRRSR